MKLLFAHDVKIYKYNDKYFDSSGSFSNEILSRYTDIFEEVRFISRQVDSNREKVEALPNLEGVEFVGVPNFMSTKTYYKKLEAVRIIEQEVKAADCVIARVPSSIGSIAVKFAKKYNKPYLLEVVGCAWDALWNHSLQGKIIAPFKHYATKRIVKDAKYVVYVTNEFLQKKYPTRGKSVNCSDVVLKEFDDTVLKARIDKINDMKENSKIVIGTIGAVNVKYKGQQYVIEALGRLKKQGITKYEYQLVGGGDQTYLKSIAEKFNVADQVKFLGPIPHYKVFDWLDTIDIYVQPSKTEGLPRALIEAMSRGLPAFGAKAGGIPELLESEYIFSNARKNIHEICIILQLFTKEKMIMQAKRNYEEAKKYDRGIIEERRRQFLMEFKNSIASSGKN
jgi:glycosyltransferase involved in cell wall biosynthesis